MRFMQFVRFSYYKTANCTTPCIAVHCYLRSGVVMPFYGWFWYSFCDLCDLCSLVNTPRCEH